MGWLNICMGGHFFLSGRFRFALRRKSLSLWSTNPEPGRRCDGGDGSFGRRDRLLRRRLVCQVGPGCAGSVSPGSAIDSGGCERDVDVRACEERAQSVEFHNVVGLLRRERRALVFSFSKGVLLN